MIHSFTLVNYYYDLQHTTLQDVSQNVFLCIYLCPWRMSGFECLYLHFFWPSTFGICQSNPVFTYSILHSNVLGCAQKMLKYFVEVEISSFCCNIQLSNVIKPILYLKRLSFPSSLFFSLHYIGQ